MPSKKSASFFFMAVLPALVSRQRCTREIILSARRHFSKVLHAARSCRWRNRRGEACPHEPGEQADDPQSDGRNSPCRYPTGYRSGNIARQQSFVKHMPQVEFAILGAGAIGSIIGAHLARAGHSVVMLARERRARQVQGEGLRIQGLVEFSVPVQTLSDASQLRAADVLIVAMKTSGTAAALEPLRRADINVAFSIQNGLMKNEQLVAAFGADRVLGSLANTSGELLSSGEVLFTRNVNLLIGELAGGESLRAQQIARTLDASGVRSDAVPDILSREWSKFASWAGFMVLSVATRAATWKYLVDPDSALLLARLVREVGTLAGACGIQLTDQSLLPVASMCRNSEQQAVEVVRNAGREFMANAPHHRMSSLQDLEAGRPLEIEETLGHAVRKAAELKLSLPLLETFHHLALGIDRARS